MKPRIVLPELLTMLLIAVFPGSLFAAPPDKPAALTSVTHDATLTGAGTAASPLGVVPPAVPPLTSVTHDGTLTGNGTAASPLSARPSNTPPPSWSVVGAVDTVFNGASTLDLVTLSLPAGSYVGMARVTLYNGSPFGTDASMSCYFATPGVQGIALPGTTESEASFPAGSGGNVGTIPVIASFALAAPQSVSLQCTSFVSITVMYSRSATFIATRVSPQ